MELKRKQNFYELLIFIVMIFWGLGFPFTIMALNAGYEPLTIIFFRFLIGSICLTIFFFKRLKNVDKKSLFGGLVLGILIFVSFYFQIAGQKFTSAANTAFITQLSIVIVPIAWAYFRKEKIGIKKIIIILLALIGLIVLTMTGNGFSMPNKGDLMILACMIFISVRLIFSSLFQIKNKVDPIVITLISQYTVMILAGISTLIFEDVPTITFEGFWPILVLGLVNTAICFTIQTVALKYLKPEKVSLINSLESVVGTIASIWLVNQPLTANVIIGGLFILLAILISEMHLRYVKIRRPSHRTFHIGHIMKKRKNV